MTFTDLEEGQRVRVLHVREQCLSHLVGWEGTVQRTERAVVVELDGGGTLRLRPDDDVEVVT